MADAKGAVPPSHADTTEQPTLRVMRLYKPRLDTRRVLPSCCFGGYSGEGLGLAPAGAATGTAVGSRGAGDFALSTALKLPDSFGNIYLGETFTAYIRYTGTLICACHTGGVTALLAEPCLSHAWYCCCTIRVPRRASCMPCTSYMGAVLGRTTACTAAAHATNQSMPTCTCFNSIMQ